MNEIYILFIIFSILFLIEKKAINILMNYIGITIIIAIIISMIEPIRKIEGEYISYILILVQVSALTILFGFIIMLYPRTSENQENKKIFTPLQGRIFLIVLFFLLIFVLYKYIPFIQNFKYELSNLKIEETLNNFKGKITNTEDIKILRKLGELIYTENNNIIKLLILTIILLLAIIALFFLILS